MVEIESKLDFFKAMVLKGAKSELENALFKSAEINSMQIEKRKKELEELSNSYIVRRIDLAKKKSEEEISLKMEANRQASRKAKENCLNDLMKNLESSLLAYSKTDEYDVKLRNDIESKIEKMTAGTIIQVMSADIKTVEDIVPPGVKIETLTPDNLGGYAFVIKDKNIRENHTFKELLNSHKYEIGKKLYTMLDEVGDDNE